MSSEPKENTYVIALYGRAHSGYHSDDSTLPWLMGEQILYLGEIKNMLGHGIFVRQNGKIYSGYHVDSFVECNDVIYDNLKFITDKNESCRFLCLEYNMLKGLRNKL